MASQKQSREFRQHPIVLLPVVIKSILLISFFASLRYMLTASTWKSLYDYFIWLYGQTFGYAIYNFVSFLIGYSLPFPGVAVIILIYMLYIEASRRKTKLVIGENMISFTKGVFMEKTMLINIGTLSSVSLSSNILSRILDIGNVLISFNGKEIAINYIEKFKEVKTLLSKHYKRVKEAYGKEKVKEQSS